MACDANYRQGISVITAYNLLIENFTLRQPEGPTPQAGIDFELNRTDEQLVNCALHNCLIERNDGYGYPYICALPERDRRTYFDRCRELPRTPKW